jgi:putative flippase GtrA
MNLFARWWRFNLVGAVGAAVQLGSLAAFTHLAPRSYLWASAAAVEIALLHNFLWHQRFTWRDRAGWTLGTLARFHFSNGLVSMLGNLVLMRLLVGSSPVRGSLVQGSLARSPHLTVIAANAVAILCCSLANFCLGNAWAFRTGVPKRPRSTLEPS